MSQKAALRIEIVRPRYLETPEPLVFPSEELVPETQLHLELRTLLYQLLKEYLGVTATIGSDQFVYYAADDPKQCLAPDVFVKLTPADGDITTWKVWERGAPDVAIEIASDSDAPEVPWQEKLRRYAKLGASEIIRFDPKAPDGRKLRIWDRVDEQLAERVVVNDCAPSLVLELTWVVAAAENRPVTLRIATDEAGKELVPSLTEALKAEGEARQAEAKARQAEAEARRTEAEARSIAEARVRELEAELKRRGG